MNTKTLDWMTVTLRDDRYFNEGTTLRGYYNKDFKFGNIYYARIQMDMLQVRVMLEGVDKFDRTINLYGNFTTDIIYASIPYFLESWDIIERRLLTEKTGHYLSSRCQI